MKQIKSVYRCIDCGRKCIRAGLMNDKPCPKCGGLMSNFGEKTIWPDDEKVN